MKPDTGLIALRGFLLKMDSSPSDQVSLPYADVVKLACLSAYYESSLEIDQVKTAIEWWSPLNSMLGSDSTWKFSIGDLEPIWTKERVNGFAFIFVELDDGPSYVLTESQDGATTSRRFHALDALASACGIPWRA